MENKEMIEELSTVETLDLVHGEYKKVVQENAQLKDELEKYRKANQLTQEEFDRLSYTERVKLKEENEELYKKMVNPKKW